MRKGPLMRLWFLNTGVLAVSMLMVGQLGYVQIVQGEEYREKAERQYRAPSASFPDRGSIFFLEKTGRKISAATMVPDYTLAIDPTQVGDVNRLADFLASVIDVDPETILAKAQRAGDRYEEIAQDLPADVVARIKENWEKGVIVSKGKKRFYPGGPMAAQVLGFVGWNKDVLGGRYGLERYYEETLARSNDETSGHFFANVLLKRGESMLSGGTQTGDIVTTIEPSVQGFLERVLEQDIRTQFDADAVQAIIMNPKTGEIYAMASTPWFDPNYFSKEKDQSVFTNPLVEGIYEMGSIVKAITMAAGLDAGVITPRTTYNDTGSRVINKKPIGNFDGKARGMVSMQEVLNQSLNMGSVFVGERLGHERLKTYFESFGLGEETGIDLPNEGLGRLQNLSSPRDIEYATASFGQGISMTPIAMIRALAALANGGTLVTPHVIKRIEYGFGQSRNFVPGGERRVIKPETSAEITDMLTHVVDTALLDGALKMDHYGIAAKTGTAQQVGENGKYSESDFLHTFFGYFPSNDPQFIIFLAAKNPQGEQYASHTLSKPFMQIAKFLINYYEIPPDR